MREVQLSSLITAALLAVACSEQKSNATSVVASSTTPPHAAAHAPASPSPAASGATTPAAQALSLVSDTSQVCMVNNQFMGKPQIPVVVEGRTYYGCCEMCKARLTNDAAARTASDALTKRPIDKSRAVMARDAAGSILYFENQANFAAYAQRGPS